MPNYTCSKCARIFKQKSHLTDHLSKKMDCSTTTAIAPILEEIKEIKKEIKGKYTELSFPESPEEKRVVLQSFFEDLHNLLWSRAGLSPEKAMEHLIFFFAYRLIELQADSLSLPQECRWSYISSIKDENDLFEIIKKGVLSFRKNEMTKHFFKPHEIQKAEIVYDIIHQINRIPLKVIQETDTLGDIFEYMLSRGMSSMSDDGQYFTNRSICSLAFKLAYNIKNTLRRPDGSLCTFADWFCGTGGFAAEYVKGVNNNLSDIDWKKDNKSIYCQDMSLSSVTTTLLNMLILTGVPFSNNNIRGGNSFTDPIIIGETAPFKDITIDYCFMNPPYGGDKTKGKEYKFAYTKGKGKTKQYLVNKEIQSIGIEDDLKVSAGTQLAMATLNPKEGICALVLPQGFFFGSLKKAVELRKKIAEEYKIYYVVDFEAGSFINTTTKTSMIIFQKGVGTTENVKFINMKEDILIEASLDDLRSKNYSLNYKQYLPQDAMEVDGFEMVKLGDICNIHFGERITKKDNIGTLYPVYGGGNDTFRTDKKNREGITCKVSRFGISEHNCVQIIHGEYWLMDSGFTITAKEDRAISSYIWNWLLQNKKSVYQCGRATAQMNMDIDTFKCLQIPLPSLDTQQQIIEAIDGWATLAHHEEEALKMLEKQVMYYVKEMGKGKKRVKLGDILEFQKKPGNLSSKDGKDSGKYPFYTCAQKKMFVDTCEFTKLCLIVNRGGLPNIRIDKGFSISHDDIHVLSHIDGTSTETTIMYIGYYIQQNMYMLENGMNGTTLKHLNKSYLTNIEIPLPSLTEQQTLQPEFDEIRHKHEKIAYYKAKAQEAIDRLIPKVTSHDDTDITDVELPTKNIIVNPKDDATVPVNDISEPPVKSIRRKKPTIATSELSEDKPKKARPQIAKGGAGF